MEEITTNSYSYQDIFALLCSNEKGLGEKDPGTFVDIGLCFSHTVSNVKTFYDFKNCKREKSHFCKT